jgi:hypothetical protein
MPDRESLGVALNSCVSVRVSLFLVAAIKLSSDEDHWKDHTIARDDRRVAARRASMKNKGSKLDT